MTLSGAFRVEWRAIARHSTPNAPLNETGAGLGQAVAHDAAAVGEALTRAFTERPTDGDRQRLASWTRDHRSLDTVAENAVDGVLQACQY